ncbi:MAG: DUF3786 domain-containing protein [Phycisphaerae bacterium]|nr:DUF3786 domain-containing protein [Phycisphaerae bacterium]
MGKPPITPLDVFKRTPRTNCGKCGLSNCMAFSLQVIQGQKRPQDCPFLDATIAGDLVQAGGQPEPTISDRPESLAEALAKDVRNVDFAAAATRLGGVLHGDRLAIRCLGRVFELDRDGGLHSLCHIHAWVHFPILQYVVHGQGKDPTGHWATFRQLNGFRSWDRFFSHRCERAFQEMADTQTDLFLDLLDVFGADFDTGDSTADRSIVLLPLPKVPILFLYWRQEEDFESKLSLLFDRATEVNLGAEGTYLLAQGIVEMFRKLIFTHGLR